MGPHGNFAGVMYELEVAGNTLELLILLAAFDTDLEQSVLEPIPICFRQGDCREFLVGGEVWGRNVVRQEDGVSDRVAEPDEIMVLNWLPQVLIVLQRKDLPVVVGVIVRVSSDLLPLAGDSAIVVTERVPVLMTVKVCLGLLVFQSDRVVVVDSDGIGQHDVITQGLLELGSHEVVSRPGSVQNGEMHLEPEEIEDEGHDDQPKCSSGKVLCKLRHGESSARTLDIQQVPQVNSHGAPNGDEGEQANVLGRDIA